ncbi:hypothetical protein K469DRAFT_811215 [Zopfia rhizophila CBS 207.26]|uniref:Uncharacterized protein n=1 Tax=Zopfia rhizophila CBS 207.26 TaxID=1314779 RepID=A0A6A6EEK1_9PEZI|nr:hypothetical protein K469DRAFT_811215 [Zopfia rhizophila CBS 207.26]
MANNSESSWDDNNNRNPSELRGELFNSSEPDRKTSDDNTSFRRTLPPNYAVVKLEHLPLDITGDDVLRSVPFSRHITCYGRENDGYNGYEGIHITLNQCVGDYGNWFIIVKLVKVAREAIKSFTFYHWKRLGKRRAMSCPAEFQQNLFPHKSKWDGSKPTTSAGFQGFTDAERNRLDKFLRERTKELREQASKYPHQQDGNQNNLHLNYSSVGLGYR